MINTNNLYPTRVIEAPHRGIDDRPHHLFLAGGIVNCPDWQSELIEQLQDNPDLTIYNPKRMNYPMADPDAAVEQISWEYDYLRDATSIAVWFSRGSLNPIVLYELGKWVNSRPEIPAFIGIDPEYTRSQDVIIQTKLVRPEIEIVHSLGALATQIKSQLDLQ